MVFGWRKAFCTSVSTKQDKTPSSKSKILQDTDPLIPTSRFRSKFGFLSNPSTPRFRSRGGGGGGGSCRSAASTTVSTPSLPTSPKLHCRTTSNATPRTSNNSSPRFLSNPSSPKSSSSTSHGGVSLHKATLLLNKSNSGRCGICLQRVNSGQINPTAIFTAECSHSFHLSCAVKLQDKRCPFCSAAWSQTPKPDLPYIGSDPIRRPEIREIKTGKCLRVYNDDEPISYSPVSLAQFNSIPESDENNDEGDEFPGFFTDSSIGSGLTDSIPQISGNLEIKLQPESAVVETGRRSETHVVVMKLKASPSPSSISDAIRAHRPSIDLVTVIDLSNGGGNLQTVKHAMRLVISLLREMDRLSIVVFSTGSKRLMPLRRMTAKGRRSARRIVDSLAGIEITGGGVGMTVNDALKKAVKVVEDRRERNPTASILVLSDGQDSPEVILKAKLNPTRVPFVVSTTRFSGPEIPVHSVWIVSQSALHHAPLRDAFTERIALLLNVALHDVKLELGLVSGSPLTEITAVYSLTGRPECFGSGSVVIGDLFAEEEREFLVELKVPTSSSGSHHVMSVRSSVVDPTTNQPMTCPKEKRFLIPKPLTVRFVTSSIERLRNLHSACRVVADSRKLIEREDLAGAYQLLMTARSNASHSDDSLRSLESELSELSRIPPRIGSRNRTEDKTEQLTPTSAWRAAEKLAKVAIMRKHLNRVSDMHGLENARF